MHDVLCRHVEHNEVAGLVTLLCRRGKVVVDTIGYQNRERREPMRRDTIFRIASMSKPVTAVAALILVEECRLRLDESLDHLLPELANRRVLRRLDGPLDDTEPAHRPLTLRDLLTFRMGFGWLVGLPEQYPVLREEAALELRGLKPSPPHNPDEWLRRLGSLPWMCQPGTCWLYHTGSDVLGILIARVAGQPFEAFLKERIFDPLGMKDTAFYVPHEKLNRLASSYERDPATHQLVLDDDARDSKWSRPPPFAAGGSGLLSTADDFLAFGQMMLNMGRVGRTRILARPTVEAMTTDQLTTEQKKASLHYPGFWDYRGWGFGLSPVTHRSGTHLTPGKYGWGGYFGTQWFNDPEEDMVSIVMFQRGGFGPTGEDFFTLAYQAIDD